MRLRKETLLLLCVSAYLCMPLVLICLPQLPSLWPPRQCASPSTPGLPGRAAPSRPLPRPFLSSPILRHCRRTALRSGEMFSDRERNWGKREKYKTCMNLFPQIIPRLNPLHPPLVPKRTVSLETLAVHHHNHQRTVILQRREHYK